MFRIIDFKVLTRFIVIATVFISAGIYSAIEHFLSPGRSVMEIVGIASTVSVVVIFLINANFFSRRLWNFIMFFDRSLFPDLNGTWGGKIIFSDDSTLEVRAVIRQKLMHTQIDMHTPSSKSITLETTPATEGGVFKLYHVYRVTPKKPDWSMYTGVTIFDVRKLAEEKKSTIELSGSYHTSRGSMGRVTLKKTGNDENVDVSFY